MNNMSLFMIIVLIIVIISLLLVVTLILKKDSKSKNNQRTKYTTDNVSLPNINSVLLPPNIERLSSGELYKISKKVYELYRYFDYRNMNPNLLDKQEWHSWQVSILLMVYKKRDDFFIPEKETVFPDFILNYSDDKIKILINEILEKYTSQVDIESGKDKLSKEYIWTNTDVSIIFYFLSHYKKYIQ